MNSTYRIGDQVVEADAPEQALALAQQQRSAAGIKSYSINGHLYHAKTQEEALQMSRTLENRGELEKTLTGAAASLLPVPGLEELGLARLAEHFTPLKALLSKLGIAGGRVTEEAVISAEQKIGATLDSVRGKLRAPVTDELKDRLNAVVQDSEDLLGKGPENFANDVREKLTKGAEITGEQFMKVRKRLSAITRSTTDRAPVARDMLHALEDHMLEHAPAEVRATLKDALNRWGVLKSLARASNNTEGRPNLEQAWRLLRRGQRLSPEGQLVQRAAQLGRTGKTLGKLAKGTAIAGGIGTGGYELERRITN